MAELHSSIVALVSLASGIASNHPAMGQCQLSKLRTLGISEEQISTVIEIARHIRDEAAQKLDHAFDDASYPVKTDIQQASQVSTDTDTNTENSASCCSSTASGQTCC